MTDDLVKRLRQWDCGESTWGLLESAADRIEKLEAALREVCKNWDSPIFESDWEALVELCEVFSERKRIARNALEGKND